MARDNKTAKNSLEKSQQRLQQQQQLTTTKKTIAITGTTTTDIEPQSTETNRETQRHENQHEITMGDHTVK